MAIDFLETIDELTFRRKNNTCSIYELRLPIFAPVKKFSTNSMIYLDFIKNKHTRRIDNEWGNITIQNKLLTQVHKDILDTIVICAESTQMLEDNRLLVCFSIKRVLKKYGSNISNSTWFREVIEDIMGALIRLKNKNNQFFYFHIINSMYFDDNNHLGGIILSSEYLSFFQETLAVNYNTVIRKIIAIDSSLIKAIIRFFIAHNFIEITLPELLLVLDIQAPKGQRYYRKIRQEIVRQTELLRSFNINYFDDSELFEYKGSKRIKFTPGVK